MAAAAAALCRGRRWRHGMGSLPLTLGQFAGAPASELEECVHSIHYHSNEAKE